MFGCWINGYWCRQSLELIRELYYMCGATCLLTHRNVKGHPTQCISSIDRIGIGKYVWVLINGYWCLGHWESICGLYICCATCASICWNVKGIPLNIILSIDRIESEKYVWCWINGYWCLDHRIDLWIILYVCNCASICSNVKGIPLNVISFHWPDRIGKICLGAGSMAIDIYVTGNWSVTYYMLYNMYINALECEGHFTHFDQIE